MSRPLLAGALAALALCLAGPADAAPRGFDVAYGGRNIVRFESSALLETIEGRTGAIEGVITLDPARVNKGPQAKLTVDLAELSTGIDKRDGHMRGPQYLDTAKFPKASFTLKSVKARSADLTKADGPTKLTLTGDLELHGVTKEVSVSGAARYIPLTKETKALKKMGVVGDALHFAGSFELALADFGITIPRFLAVKIADRVSVRVDLFAFAPAR